MPASEIFPHPVVTLQRNTCGRDFVVGDLHGMFAVLERLLEAIHFEPAQDRLFSVGDLVDRGPDSPRALAYLDKPWFHAIRGNHEDILVKHCEAPDDHALYEQWMRNGGSWWKDTTATVRRQLYHQLSRLPLAMEVDTQRGLVGIVHADLPAEHDWPAFVAALKGGDGQAILTALWSRQRAKLWRIAARVPGVKDIYCGHTMVKTPRSAGNVHYIDTGACHPAFGQLTAVNLNLGVTSAVTVNA